MMINELMNFLSLNEIKLTCNNNELNIHAKKGSLNNDILSIIKDHKVELLRFLSKQSSYDSIESIPKQNSYPLSHSQKRLWVLNKFSEDSLAYNMPSIFNLTGSIDISALSEAFHFMIERHEILRTVFIEEDGEPRQKILAERNNEIKIYDLSINHQNENELIDSEVLKPFDLESGPLIRMSLIIRDPRETVLIVNVHHIISDGWSINLFSQEFLKAYSSFQNNELPTLESLSIQYKDYTSWFNNYLIEIDTQKNYWIDKLSGELPVLNLPSDKVRPSQQTFNGANEKFNLSPEKLNKINNLCSSQQVSIFMILQGIVKVLLYKYTGQNDIILGSPVAGRIHKDLENQLGCYVNTIAFRDNIHEDETFLEFLSKVKISCIEGFDNQAYPFDLIVDDLGVKRDLSRSPIFDVMLTLQNNDKTDIHFDNVDISPFDPNLLISKFDLSFDFEENNGNLNCNIEYNTDIYESHRIKRLCGHFNKLVDVILDNSNCLIKEIELITDDERNLILNVFNDTKAPFPSDKTLADLIEDQVVLNPDREAVIHETTHLSYRELNELSNRVGNYLKDQLNIQADDLVGVMMDRSELMIITILGILKSGGAYVPIDPNYPQDRIDYILDDSCPKAVIVDNISTNYLDINKILGSSENIENPVRTNSPQSLAYVIYTSGSTGKPKGTLIENASIINRLIWMQTKYPLSENDIILQKTTFTFDVSVWELFWWSIFGSKVCFLKPEGEKDPHEILRIISQENISVIHFVPSMLNVLIEYYEIEKDQYSLSSLKRIF